MKTNLVKIALIAIAIAVPSAILFAVDMSVLVRTIVQITVVLIISSIVSWFSIEGRGIARKDASPWEVVRDLLLIATAATGAIAGVQILAAMSFDANGVAGILAALLGALIGAILWAVVVRLIYARLRRETKK